MGRFLGSKQILVLVTALLAFWAFAGVFYLLHQKKQRLGSVDFSGSPAFGRKDAPGEMVLFEDLECGGCRAFNLEVLPALRKNYIDTGLVRLTIVPLAFLPGSKPLANAALAVYKIAPDRFLAYIDAICHESKGADSKEAIQQKLINLAKAIGGIDLLEFKSCVMTDCHYSTLEKNFLRAKEVMGRDFGTPTLYLNGLSISTDSFQAVEAELKQAIHP